MWLYAFVMVLVGAILMSVGNSVRGGKTELIHSYHQKRVTDKLGYSRAMGGGLIAMGAFFTASGALPLIWHAELAMTLSLCLLAAGIVVGLALIIRAQIRYNKGIF